MEKTPYIIYVYYGMRNLLRRKGGPNAPAATPQIDINFSRREGATTWGEGVRRGCEKVRRGNNVGRGRAPRL